jgi:hypothetical protein
MGLKKDFAQRAMATKRGEELELIVTESFPTDPYYVGGICRTSVDKGQLLKVIDFCENRLHLKGEIDEDYLLLGIPIAFVSGCMEEVTDTIEKPETERMIPVSKALNVVRDALLNTSHFAAVFEEKDRLEMVKGISLGVQAVASEIKSPWQPLCKDSKIGDQDILIARKRLEGTFISCQVFYDPGLGIFLPYSPPPFTLSEATHFMLLPEV